VFAHRAIRSTSLLLIATLFFQLCAPAVLFAQEKERFDRRLLTSLANRIEVIAGKMCERVSAAEENTVELTNFHYDHQQRIFANFKGSIVLRLEEGSRWREKVETAAGTHMATNGSLAFDFCIKKVEKMEENRYRIDFQADFILVLSQIVRQVFYKAASIIGAVTIGAALSKMVTFFENLDAAAFGEAIHKATMKLWMLSSAEAASRGYEILNKTGHLSVKQILTEGFTSRSIVYHFGVFVLQAGVAAGATVAKMSFGAAIGCSLATQVGVFVGAALAMTAVTILGNIVVTKLTKDLPLWLSFRKLRSLQNSLLKVNPRGTEATAIRNEMVDEEDKLAEWIDDEITLDDFTFLDKIVGRLRVVKEKEGNFAPYEGLIGKLKAKLAIPMVHDKNWNAARKYYQLLEVLGRLPNTAVAQ